MTDTDIETQTGPVLMTPKEAWLYAAEWGSFMDNGDPGACMYGFDENFLMQSEEHRRQVLDQIDNHCIPEVTQNPDWFDKEYDGAEHELAQLARLRVIVETAPLTDNTRYDKLDAFTKAYITAALWVGVEYPEGHPDSDSDKYCEYHQAWIEPDSFKAMVKDCRRFQAKNADIIAAAEATGKVRLRGDLKSALELAGHDFFMTRNGHGVGFWDGDWPEPYADQLDNAAKKFGDCDLYTGDDGRVYSNG